MSQQAHSNPLRILAGDIGGTYTRLAACTVDSRFRVRTGNVFRMATRQPGVDSFASFWQAVRDMAPPELGDETAFDAVGLALAGSVAGDRAVLPNIDWDIGTGDLDPFASFCLVNDFVAQGWALAANGIRHLEPVREGQDGPGAVAMVGAGTGLGHCSIHPPTDARDGELNPGWSVTGSEAGHATFAFHGLEEKEIEERLLELTGEAWLSNDDVVSGPGAARLHTALSGETVEPAEALRDPDGETARWFARLYARACRNYCLNIFPVSRLVISGGVAARNPHLVHSSAFREEFEDAGAYRNLLHHIPIGLNRDQDLGMTGAAVFAAVRLRAAGPAKPPGTY
ncbi:glucokinase [Elongatibacter sediminis]|uniref:Glucokinase n=1 Tax=Elongatibacter sediminis TaxID=3119006 RepID=A0AAW9RE98_9GAMM